jgi:hypothetical protein
LELIAVGFNRRAKREWFWALATLRKRR